MKTGKMDSWFGHQCSQSGDKIQREIKYRLYIRVQMHGWQFERLTLQLGVNLVQVVQVDMCITQCVNKITGLQAGRLGNHHGKQ